MMQQPYNPVDRESTWARALSALLACPIVACYIPEPFVEDSEFTALLLHGRLPASQSASEMPMMGGQSRFMWVRQCRREQRKDAVMSFRESPAEVLYTTGTASMQCLLRRAARSQPLADPACRSLVVDDIVSIAPLSPVAAGLRCLCRCGGPMSMALVTTDVQALAIITHDGHPGTKSTLAAPWAATRGQ